MILWDDLNADRSEELKIHEGFTMALFKLFSHF